AQLRDRPDQVLMFVDGTDTLLQRDQAYILSQVADMKKPILFSSERDMFPATDWVRKAYPKIYPVPPESAFMHLNSGGWVANSPPALLAFYRDWANAPFMSYHWRGKDDGTMPGFKKGGNLVLDSPQKEKVYLSAQELWDLRDQPDATLPRIYQ
ncbi:hypothetical protein B484DRAFT_437454, partial [Ochromonadaceae sp. CCMP2298]